MTPTNLPRALDRLLARLLAPGACLACGVVLEHAGTLCRSCSDRLPRVPNPCACCAQPSVLEDPVCPRCLLDPPRWQRMIAPYQYRGLVRRYLLQIKFGEATHLVRTLCDAEISPFRRIDPPPEALLPVPLHRGRLLERGYNQAAEIAAIWSRALDIPVDRQALRRVRATPSQSGLGAARRRQNLRGAFAFDAAGRYRHVALVDDIVTTGSTVDEIVRLLHRGGIEFVEVWSLARVYRR